MARLELHSRTKANAVAFAKELIEEFPEILTVYGWRQDALQEHPSGRALDVMLPSVGKNKWNTALGQRIANYVWQHRDRIKLQHQIWNGQIISVPRAREGWRGMRLTGNLNADHRNHVHIWLKDEKFTPLKTEEPKKPAASKAKYSSGKYETVASVLNVRSSIGGGITKTLKKGQRADVVRVEEVTRSHGKEYWGYTAAKSWVCIQQGNTVLMRRV